MFCRKSLTSLILYGTAFHLWSSFVLVQFDDSSEEAADVSDPNGKRTRAANYESEADGTDRIEDSLDEDPVHIPLSWPRRKEGKFYAASDSEWQEFVRVSKDPNKIKTLKGRSVCFVIWINGVCTYMSKMSWHLLF